MRQVRTNPGKLRSGHAKTRTGCRTCKIRRVKCDEARPVCARCSDTGRACDGYEAAGTARKWTVVTGPPPVLAAVHREWLDDDVSRSSFDFFRAVSAVELSRFFGRSFWCQSLLCASEEFPAVMSAMLAVASLHRQFKDSASVRGQCPETSVQQTGQPLNHPFSTQKYDKAVKQLIRSMSGADRSHCRLMSLICGVLFAVIETLQGNDAQALGHLDGIIKLLNEQHHPTPGGNLVTDMEQDLKPVVSRLDVEASIFSTRRAPGLTLPPLPLLISDDAPAQPFDLDQAADELNNLMAHMSHFKRTQANHLRYEVASDIPLPVLHAQQRIVAHFRRWLRDAELPLAAAIDSEQSSRSALLRIHYHTSWTMLQCCLNTEETVYDRYMNSFADIVRWADMLAETESQPMPLSSFSVDTGIVFPLYWTVLRCRDGRLRREALARLRACGREGVWIPEIQARVAERAIEIEEGLVAGSLELVAAAEPFPTSADILEFRRVHCVGLDVDKENRKVRMTYHRRLNGLDGEWDIEQEWLSY